MASLIRGRHPAFRSQCPARAFCGYAHCARAAGNGAGPRWRPATPRYNGRRTPMNRPWRRSAPGPALLTSSRSAAGGIGLSCQRRGRGGHRVWPRRVGNIAVRASDVQRESARRAAWRRCRAGWSDQRRRVHIAQHTRTRLPVPSALPGPAARSYEGQQGLRGCARRSARRRRQATCTGGRTRLSSGGAMWVSWVPQGRGLAEPPAAERGHQ